MDEPMRDLVRESRVLLKREENTKDSLHDYAFVVFPMAKAYEGFLKKLFFDLRFINKQQYVGDRFRIGKALNPHLPKRYQWDWVFDRLVKYCNQQDLPLRLWETWKRARNRIFHFFPDHHEFISLNEAKDMLELIEETMNLALTGCKIGN